MLTLTDNASAIVKAIVDQTVPGEDSGIRFFQEAEQDGALTVEAVPAAEPGDHLVERDGARVYLQETAVEVLGDSVLDAAVDPEGGVQFSLAPADPAA